MAEVTEGTQDEGERERIKWHAGFREAFRADLGPDLAALEIYDEFPLSAEALRIDIGLVRQPGWLPNKSRKTLRVLLFSAEVVRKLKFPNNSILAKRRHTEGGSEAPGASRALAAFFLDWNVVEFKGPEDSFSVRDLHKTLAYAHLLAADKGAEWERTTVTIIRTGRSDAVLRYLEGKPGCRIEEKRDAGGHGTGIWEVRGYGDIAIQVVQSEELPEEEYRWLRNLRGGLAARKLSELLTAGGPLYGSLKAYFQVVVEANKRQFREVLGMFVGDTEIRQTLDETGWTALLTADVWQKAEQERKKAEQGRQAVLQYLREIGLSTEQRAEVERRFQEG